MCLFFQMTATIKLAVTSDLAQITKSDFSVCALRFNEASYTGLFFANPATSVNCGASQIHNLTRGNPSLVQNDMACSSGHIVKKVGGKDKCGMYH